MVKRTAQWKRLAILCLCVLAAGCTPFTFPVTVNGQLTNLNTKLIDLTMPIDWTVGGSDSDVSFADDKTETAITNALMAWYLGESNAPVLSLTMTYGVLSLATPPAGADSQSGLPPPPPPPPPPSTGYETTTRTFTNILTAPVIVNTTTSGMVPSN